LLVNKKLKGITMKDFIKDYTQKLISLLENIDIQSIVKLTEQMISTKGQIYVLGNGGSAATASHMVNDLGIGLKRRNLANLKITSLSDNTPVTTAIANDIGYENIFYSQLVDNINSNDLIIAISCSGNSANIIKAVEYSKIQNTPIIALTGFDGGKLKDLCDINFHISTNQGEYGLVEDMHMILDHIIYSYFIQK